MQYLQKYRFYRLMHNYQSHNFQKQTKYSLQKSENIGGKRYMSAPTLFFLLLFSSILVQYHGGDNDNDKSGPIRDSL